jgi:predicted acetyltransferase
VNSDCFTTRPLDGDMEEDLREYSSVACESLLCADRERWQTYLDRIGRENIRAVYCGSRCAGGMAFYRMAHWFGGNEIACGGFSGVAINPADRGSGVCGAMLRSVLEELRSQRVPLASLYASTQRLYRSVGFEQAGLQSHYSIPISSIGSCDRSLPIHRFESPPMEKMQLVANTRAERTNGNLSRTDGLWQRILEPHDGLGTTTYLIGDVDSPDGFAIFKGGSLHSDVPQPLVSTDVAANTPEAIERLLSLVRDHRSMCDGFEWFGPPNDPLVFAADEQWVRLKHWMTWMLRIVDLPAALSQRGYCRSVEGTLHLDIVDELLRENSGRWRVHFSDGRATVEPGGDGRLRMNIQALAPLFSARYSAQQLIRLGIIESSRDQQTQLATAAMAGDAPWLPELF